MANWVMRRLLGYRYNLYTGFEDQFKDIERPWKFLGSCLGNGCILPASMMPYTR